MILIDSNVLIDVFADDPVWRDWSLNALAEAAAAGPVVINSLVVAEVAPRYGELDDFLDRMENMGICLEPFTETAAYAAGQAFQDYRKKRLQDNVKVILPDFLIGGHARILGADILTRDPRHYRNYFPDISLITPEASFND